MNRTSREPIRTRPAHRVVAATLARSVEVPAPVAAIGGSLLVLLVLLILGSTGAL